MFFAAYATRREKETVDGLILRKLVLNEGKKRAAAPLVT